MKRMNGTNDLQEVRRPANHKPGSWNRSPMITPRGAGSHLSQTTPGAPRGPANHKLGLWNRSR